jgi:hypothetical protein
MNQNEMKCSFEPCYKKARCGGMCKTHYEQKRTGREIKIVRPKGSGSLSKGYLLLFKPDHPNSDSSGRVPEHRFIMSELLGRPLLPSENVHHKNGRKQDNSPENLELWVSKQPYGQRPEDLVRWAREILELYDKEIPGEYGYVPFYPPPLQLIEGNENKIY